MKIGIYSKFQCSGGSEYRSAEICNSIRKYTNHESFLLVRGKKIPKEIEEYLDKDVPVYLNMLKSDDGGNGSNVEKFYEMDKIIVINSDNYSWTQRDLWEAKAIDKKTGKLKNETRVDLSKIKSMYFLMNFVVSPSQHLWQINEIIEEMGIIVTNEKFFKELSQKDKFDKVRHLPRIICPSPIDPSNICHLKTPSDKIRIGQHSKSFGDKWNEEYPDLINAINEKHGSFVHWDLMGVKSAVSENIKAENVTIRKEYEKSVRDFLKGVDIFLFFPSYKREEPFCRVIEEAMMSGCPIIANKSGGNLQQIVHENNGFLYESFSDIVKFLDILIQDKNKIKIFGRNSRIYSKEYESERVIKKIMDFINCD